MGNTSSPVERLAYASDTRHGNDSIYANVYAMELSQLSREPVQFWRVPTSVGPCTKGDDASNSHPGFSPDLAHYIAL